MIEKVKGIFKLRDENKRMIQEITQLNLINGDLKTSIKNFMEDVSERDNLHKEYVEKLNQDIDELKEKLSNTQKELTTYKIRERIQQMSDIEREEINSFPIYPEKEEFPLGKTILYKGICSLGGCEMEGVEFPTYEEALKYGVELTLNGGCVDTRHACQHCYKEYMRECV
jgi:hypothetical protein